MIPELMFRNFFEMELVRVLDVNRRCLDSKTTDEFRRLSLESLLLSESIDTAERLAGGIFGPKLHSYLSRFIYSTIREHPDMTREEIRERLGAIFETCLECPAPTSAPNGDKK